MINERAGFRTHRVGSLTAGLTLILSGIAFLLHTLFDVLSYTVIFKLWPLILIMLGVELLLSRGSSDGCVYDKGSVFIIVIMELFALLMAVVDTALPYLERVGFMF